MEKRSERTCFFFANSFENFNTLLTVGASKFERLFTSHGKNKQLSSPGSFISYVQVRHENRYVELVWLSEDDPLRIKQFEQMPIIDYWHLLNRRIEQLEKAKRK